MPTKVRAAISSRPEPTPARLEEFSLERRVRSDWPPFFLVHAKDDQTVPAENSVLLAKALKRAGVPFQLLLVEEGGHGFGLGRGKSVVWKENFLSWLDALP